MATAALALLPAAALAREDAPGEILLQRAPGVTAAEAAQVRRDAGVRLVDRPLPGVDQVAVAGADPDAALAQLRRDPDVAWAEPNRLTRATSTVTDPYFQYQWGLENTGLFGTATTTADADIDITGAWPIGIGAGVTVAVVDSGVKVDHPDLAGRLLPGFDFLDGAGDVTDLNGHGTQVSGVIAADANAIGTVGVAPGASVEPLRILDAQGVGTTADSASAFDRAGTEGIRIVNASISAARPTTVELLAIQRHPDTLFVVAAGNDGQDLDATTTRSYPCSYAEPNVICVGASDWNDRPARYSNRGRLSVDLFAPGDTIYSTSVKASYAYMNGTSAAAPMVAGTAALLAGARPELTPLEIKQRLLDTVDHPAALDGLSVSGGRLNAAAALADDGAVRSADATAPGVPDDLQAEAGDGEVRLSWDGVASPDLAGYRVYEATGGDDFLPAADAGQQTEHTVDELANGTTYAFRVTAVDNSGNESAPSDVVTVTPRTAPQPIVVVAEPAPAPAPTTPAPERVPEWRVPVSAVPAPAPQPTPTRPAAARGSSEDRDAAKPAVTRLRVVGRPTGTRSSKARLELTLSARTQVKLTLQRKVCRRSTAAKRTRCRYRASRSRTLTLSAGRHRLRVTTRLAGLRVTRGSWRVRATTAAGTRTVALRVGR